MAAAHTDIGEAQLLGAWHLVGYHDVDEHGERQQGPLGPAPSGLLIYQADGLMSVSMMRNSDDPQAEIFMGYAGTWHVDGLSVVHGVTVSSHRHMVGTTQIRHASLRDDDLTLVGTAMVSGRAQCRTLQWRRARP